MAGTPVKGSTLPASGKVLVVEQCQRAIALQRFWGETIRARILVRTPFQGLGVSDLIFLGYKITADGDCSHEIKRRLLLGRKVMTNLDSILKSRDVTLPTKVRLVKAIVFPVSCMDMRVGL